MGAFIAAAIVVGLCRAFIAFADMRGSLLLVFGLGMFFAHVWPHFRVSYDGKVEVVDSQVPKTACWPFGQPGCQLVHPDGR